MPLDDDNGNHSRDGMSSNNNPQESPPAEQQPQNNDPVEDIVIDRPQEENQNNPDGDVELDVNIELVNNEEILVDNRLDYDADAEEFRRRFYEAISRRNAQLVESPQQYEEEEDVEDDIDDEDEEEDDNINLIDDLIEDPDDSFDGVTTRHPSSSREDRESADDGRGDSSVPVFDLQLPTRHSYLGDAMETLSGRTILEGGSTTDIPLVLLDFHLVPGQTLPLTVFHAGTQSALRQCVPSNRHFGIVHSGLNDVNIRAPIPRRALGTTCEIYEFQEEQVRDNHIPPSVNIKAKGRHRFNVLSTYRQSDGHLFAKVKIRPEISLVRPWRNLMSGAHRHMFPVCSPDTFPSPTTTPRRTSADRRGRRHSENSNSSSKIHDLVIKEKDELKMESQPEASSSSSSSESRENMTGLKSNKSIDVHQKGRSSFGPGRDPAHYYSALMGWYYFPVLQGHERITKKLSSSRNTPPGQQWLKSTGSTQKDHIWSMKSKPKELSNWKNKCVPRHLRAGVKYADLINGKLVSSFDMDGHLIDGGNDKIPVCLGTDYSLPVIMEELIKLNNNALSGTKLESLIRPYFVYEQFDEAIFVEKLHRKLHSELSSLATASVSIPRDPTELSFWLAQNLTLSDALRLQMLKMDTPIERLRFANKLIDKVSRVIECKECQAKIADHADIFSMSVEGPQGTYVNPHGYVHELITVTRIKGALYRGPKSTESSWFPGYAWTILDCRLCSEHIGWKFTAEERLKPSKFWGLARKSISINFKYDFSLDNDCVDLDTPQQQQPSNADRSHNQEGIIIDTA